VYFDGRVYKRAVVISADSKGKEDDFDDITWFTRFYRGVDEISNRRSDIIS
jgi:hypothetical protein